jgi:hypothetical protein
MLPRILAPLALVVAAALLPGSAADADPADPADLANALAPPAAPTDLRATYDAAAGSVALGWTPAAGDVQRYVVHRNGLPLGSTEASGFADPDPFPLAAYTVTAVTAGGESPPSAPAVVVLPSAIPGRAAVWIGLPFHLDAVILGMPACEPVVVGGLPPSAHVNWACIDVAALEG